MSSTFVWVIEAHARFIARVGRRMTPAEHFRWRSHRWFWHRAVAVLHKDTPTAT